MAIVAPDQHWSWPGSVDLVPTTVKSVSHISDKCLRGSGSGLPPSLAARLLERVSRKQRTKLPGSGGILSPSSTVSFCVERMQNVRTRHFSFIPQLRNVLTSHARVGSAGFKRFKVDADSAYARKSCCRENARGAVVNRSELFAIYAGVVLIV